MKEPFKYITVLLQALLLCTVFISCADEHTDLPENNVDFCVRAAWQNGLTDSHRARTLYINTRAHIATDILAEGTEDIIISTEHYPTTINVHCSDGQDFTLTKGAALCYEHNTYWTYTPSLIYKDKKIARDNLTFSATAVIDEDGNPATADDGDRLTGTANIDNLLDNHMLFTLHHTKALLRFAFKVDEKYDNVRYIKVTGITLNGTPCMVVEKVLNRDNMQLIGYAYIDPKTVTTSYENTIQCTYNIYDKDDATDAHLTRKDVVAQNKFRLGSLKKADGVSPVATIETGFYYDLKVTLNPDYLYVLAEHDNKHITIE